MSEQELRVAWRGPRSRLASWWRLWLIPVSVMAGFDIAASWATAWIGQGQFAVIIAVAGVISVAANLWIAWEAVR